MMLLQEINFFFLFSKQVQGCRFSRGGTWEIQWPNLFPDAALPKTGWQFQVVDRACKRILGGKGIIVISSEGILVSYFCNAHSILDKLPLHRGAWQQGEVDTALTMTWVMYTFQVTNIGVTRYDKVGSSHQRSVFWHSIHFYFLSKRGVNHSTHLFQGSRAEGKF